MNSSRISIAACLTLCAAFARAAAFLTAGETAVDFRDAPTAPAQWNGAENGGELRADGDNAWILADTTNGKVGNLGCNFDFNFDKNSDIVKRVNEVLAQPVGSPYVDFVIRADLERFAGKRQRLVAVNFGYWFAGAKTPPRPVPQEIDLKNNPAFVADFNTETQRHRDTENTIPCSCASKNSESSVSLCPCVSVLNLEFITPRARFRVWPSGGANTIDALMLRVGIRVDHESEPFRMRVASPRVAEIKMDSATQAQAAQALRGGKIALCPDGMPPAPFIETWRKLGISARAGLKPAANETVAAVFCASMSYKDPDAETIAAHVKTGAKLYIAPGLIGLPNGAKVAPALEALLPANPWTFFQSLKRDGGEGEACAGFTYGSSAKPPHLPRSFRFDMHLPGAAIESPLIRYEPEKFLRDRKVFKRVSVLMRDASTGHPLLLDADVGASRVALFAGDFDDGIWRDGYALWARAVAALPFGKTYPDDTLSPPDSLAWARDAARKPYSIAIEEDETTLGEIDAISPANREGVDGVTSHRYTYRPGTAPRLTLRLRNHIANIAPLAKATDLQWPENPSAAGLNDQSYTHATTRGTVPIHPAWAGKQSATQRVALTWTQLAHIRSTRLTGGGDHRFWHRNNPRHLAFFADATPAPLYATTNAVFEKIPAAPMRAFFTADLSSSSSAVAAAASSAADTPVRARALALAVRGLDPAADREPRRDWPSNCSITEWEVFGWLGDAAKNAPQKVALTLQTENLLTGEKTTKELGEHPLPPFAEKTIQIELEPLAEFGPVRHTFTMRAAGKNAAANAAAAPLATENFDVLHVPAEGAKLVKKLPEGVFEAGLLCTPGWRQADSFGLGMNNWTSGWGGPHDKIWAYEQELLEMGSRNRDDPGRMFATATRASHYTNPWKYFLNGQYSWDWVADHFLARATGDGDLARRGVKQIRIVGSDRWNGVPAGSTFGWGVYDHFDKWLAARRGHGLKSRTRDTIGKEIEDELGDLWQIYSLETYAEKMLETKRKFAAAGLEFQFETHGSFPIAGGELGRKLAETHSGVGTDLFWELRRQDLWHSLASRFAVVAANPDLRSGAYDEWGWVNSDANKWWYANNGDDTVARRGWYATYFMGRLGAVEGFRPYHEMGFSSQGGHGVRYNARDHYWRTRVHNLVTQLRPETPAGLGIVVSWRQQETRMGKTFGPLGFGLYPARGEEDLVTLCEKVAAPLMKSGLPISFVTSADALRDYAGPTLPPLILVDGANWPEEDKQTLSRLSAAGTKTYPVSPAEATPTRAQEILADLGDPIRVTRGLAVVPFISHDHLCLSVMRQSEDPAPAWLEIDPKFFHPSAATTDRVISLDDGAALPVKYLPNGALRISIPALEDSSGRVLIFGKERKTNL